MKAKKYLILTIWSLIFYGCSENANDEEAAKRMQNFVINISKYARQIKPGFIVIPQNGIELAFNKINLEEGENIIYMGSVNGFGIEELFYSGIYAVDNERLIMARQLKKSKKILVSEYVTDEANIQDAYKRNYDEGFLCFARTKENYHYKMIPSIVPNENSENIDSLSQAKNFLYLINSDNFSSKENMISSISQTNFDIIIMDLFFNGIIFNSNEIERLKIKANGSKRIVICYISIGSGERFRYYWKRNWKLESPSWIKKKYGGYDDEYWVEFWNKEWQDIIYGNDDSYIKKIIDAGFDGAYLDNVEGYYFLYN